MVEVEVGKPDIRSVECEKEQKASSAVFGSGPQFAKVLRSYSVLVLNK